MATPIEMTPEQKAARVAEVEAHLLKRWTPEAYGATFMGVALEQLSADALRGVCAHAADKIRQHLNGDQISVSLLRIVGTGVRR
jgi:hypothetical protein